MSATARLGRERVPKATKKVRTARQFPASIVPKALVHVETSADSRTKDQTNQAARVAKARKRTTKEITNPPQWAKSCPEAVSAQVAMTPAPSSSSEATASGLSVPVNNSANSESVAALAERCVVSSWISRLWQSHETSDARQVCWVCGSTEIPCVRCT